jgi:putative FmdB family regulatory protein
MPTYEFRCPLGHEFEIFYRSISRAEAQAACPVCGQLGERMMSAGAGLVFKGSGFYLTDYGKNAHREKGTPDAKGEGAKGESSPTEAKADSPKSDGGSSSGDSSSSGSSDGGKSEVKKADPKPAESKPAAPPKSSSGE